MLLCKQSNRTSVYYILFSKKIIQIKSPFGDYFARLAGFEPVTSPVTGERSNQLSYNRIFINFPNKTLSAIRALASSQNSYNRIFYKQNIVTYQTNKRITEKLSFVLCRRVESNHRP
jgi:hypothetical protein